MVLIIKSKIAALALTAALITGLCPMGAYAEHGAPNVSADDFVDADDGENPFALPDGVTMTGTLTLPETLLPGQWRPLTEAEVNTLRRECGL